MNPAFDDQSRSAVAFDAGASGMKLSDSRLARLMWGALGSVSLVFGLIGVVFGTFVTRSLFTVNSFIATVGVTGVVVNDSLVLIDFINHRVREGLPIYEASVDGAKKRQPDRLQQFTLTQVLVPLFKIERREDMNDLIRIPDAGKIRSDSLAIG